VAESFRKTGRHLLRNQLHKVRRAIAVDEQAARLDAMRMALPRLFAAFSLAGQTIVLSVSSGIGVLSKTPHPYYAQYVGVPKV